MTRVLDAVLAAFGLLMSAPVMLLSAVGIRASSPGTVLYRAERAGLDGSPFTMYKFRTMHTGREWAGRITGGQDSRIFWFGRLLRGLKVDEIPQLANVLRGDMSIVGPRPEDMTIVREHYDTFMWESLTVPPGLTGPGSLDYFADEAGLPADPVEAEAVYVSELLPRKIALDLLYVRQPALRYYGGLIVRTALGIILPPAIAHRLCRNRVEWERNEAHALLADGRAS